MADAKTSVCSLLLLISTYSLNPHVQLGFPRKCIIVYLSLRTQIDPLSACASRYAGPLTQLVKRSLQVSNPNNQPVAFKVKTTAPKQYCVRPNSGRIEPGEKVEVQGERPSLYCGLEIEQTLISTKSRSPPTTDEGRATYIC